MISIFIIVIAISAPLFWFCPATAACELCLLTVEGRFAEAVVERGLAPVTPSLAQFKRLGYHMTHPAGDKRFSDDLDPCFKRLLPVWD